MAFLERDLGRRETGREVCLASCTSLQNDGTVHPSSSFVTPATERTARFDVVQSQSGGT
jgi:hypothetical protein